MVAFDASRCVVILLFFRIKLRERFVLPVHLARFQRKI